MPNTRRVLKTRRAVLNACRSLQRVQDSFLGVHRQKAFRSMMTRIRASRISRNLALKDVAKAVSLSESYIGHLEHGRLVPSESVTKRLAAYFQIKPTVLFEPVELIIRKAQA